MNQTVYLDPELTAPYEPREGDERNSQSIAPSDIPMTVTLWTDVGTNTIHKLSFGYIGGETGTDWKPLDSAGDPTVQIKPGRLSGKILDAHFAPPITDADFPRIAERIKATALRAPTISARFSHLMIAELLRHWPELSADHASQATS